MKKVLKTNKGVTLIALVVTIVILIILAAVSMTMVLGDNGIFEQAKKGANSMASAEANTQEGFNSISKEIDQIITGEVEPEGMTVVEMFEKAQADGCDGTNCTDEEQHLHPGDYVDYKNPTSGSYTSQGEKTGTKRAKEIGYYEEITDEILNQTFKVSNETKWRVLGIEEKEGKKHLLLLGSQIKKDTVTDNPFYYLYGANGYLNGEEELNNICKIYKNNLAQEARSVRIEDINLACNVVVEKNEVHLKGESTNIDKEESLGKVRTLKIGEWTPETYLLGEPLKEDKIVTGNAYMYYPEEICKNMNQKMANMLFNPSNSYNVEKEYGYWLASSFIQINVPDTRVYLPKEVWGICSTGFEWENLIVGSGDFGGLCMPGSKDGEFAEDLEEFAVRPVISLKSEISQNQLHRIEDQTEPEFPQKPEPQ